jgi:ABC-2 type transport system permease protein
MSVASLLRRSLAVAEKDMRIYYLKGPVIIMGVLFPFFLFLAFLVGRSLSPEQLFVALVSLAAFFTSTAVGPTIVPWEARSRTLERLLSAPVSLEIILLGDMQASFYFGLMVSGALSLTPLILGISICASLYVGGLILSLLCFSALTILLSAYPPTDVPADVMMLSSLVKFTLLFISGVFIPLDKLPLYGRIASYISPLTYLVDIMRQSVGYRGFIPLWLDLTSLALFTAIFLYAGITLHKRILPKRFS